MKSELSRTRKLTFGTLVFCAFLLGGWVGATYKKNQLNSWFIKVSDDWALLNIQCRISSGVQDLAMLQCEQHANLIAEKQSDLGRDIDTVYHHYFDEVVNNTNDFRTLMMVVRYWNDHPFKVGDLEVDNAITNFVREVTTKAQAAGAVIKSPTKPSTPIP